MNTLSIRDHGDDNEAAVIRAALLEAEIPVPDVLEYVPSEEPMYALVSDDAPEYSDMMLAMQDALMDTLELESMREWDANWDLVEKIMEAEYEFFNSPAASDDLVAARESDLILDISPVIGESALEIGETVAESNQDLAVTHPYTVTVMTPGAAAFRHDFLYPTLNAAVDTFLDQLYKVMEADPGRDYYEFINDSYTDSAVGWETIRGLSIGFTAEWTDEDQERWREIGEPEFDPSVLPRGVYMFASDLGDDDEVYQSVTHAIRHLDASSMTHAGWMIENWWRDDFEDNSVEHSYHVGEHPSQVSVNLDWVVCETDPDEFCETCGNSGEVSLAPCGDCKCYEWSHYLDGYGEDMIFRHLDSEEAPVFRTWARENFTPDMDINPLWHPIVRDECAKMLMELLQQPEECSLCAGTGEVTVICHDGTELADFPCPNCDVYERMSMSQVFGHTPSA
jgi:hypothetical protein